MKKYIVLLMCILVAACAYGSAESDQLVRQMVDAASQAFGSLKMFDEPVNAEGLWKWNAAINGAQKSILAANKKNKKASGYRVLIDKANSQLIHAIEDTYDTAFLPFADKSELSDTQKRDFKIRYDNCKERFNAVKNDMFTLIKELNKSSLFESSVSKKDLIVALVDIIMRYASNAISSLEFKALSDNKFSRKRSF